MRLRYLPLRGILKPIVGVTVLGARAANARALVDSGADFSLFDATIAAYAGIEFDPRLRHRVSGIGGTITVDGAWVDTIVTKRRLRLLMFFAPNLPVNLLGRDNFFHFFRVGFDELNHELELRYRRRSR